MADRCRACGKGFDPGNARMHVFNVGDYHAGACVEGAYRAAVCKMYSRDDLEMSQRQCRTLQSELDSVRRELAQIKMVMAGVSAIVDAAQKKEREPQWP